MENLDPLEVAYQFSVFLVSVLIGLKLTVPIISYLKKTFKTSGSTTVVLVYLFALITTLALMVTEHFVTPEYFYSGSWGTFLVNIVVLSQIQYQRIIADLEKEELSHMSSTPLHTFGDQN